MPLELVRDWMRELRPNPAVRSKDEREFLPAALEIVETPASPTGRLIALCISAAAVIALLWSIVGRVDVIATAPGRIVPIGNTKVVQPMDVGLVKAIHVSDGDYVHAGQVLVELDPVQSRAERDQFSEQLRDASLQLAVLQALWNSLRTATPPELAAIPSGVSDNEIQAANAAMKARRDEQAATLADLDQQIAEKKADVDASDSSVSKLEASLPFVQQQADLRGELLKLQYTSKLAYLQAQQALVEQSRQIDVLKSEKSQAVAQMMALRQKRQESIDTYQKNLLDDRSKAEAQVAELRANFAKAQASLSDKTLRAPISGTIQELAVHTIGGVVTPAQPLMIIVPSGGGLAVEAMVSNRDVGFVHIGQTARVKIDTFTFTRYGLIDGTVVGLSHDVVGQDSHDGEKKSQDADTTNSNADPSAREPSYVARVRLARNWMETETGRVNLGPGMIVTAEIQTGRRRIIDYLLSPLQSEVKDSLHER